MMKATKLAWVLIIPLMISSCDEDPVLGCMDELATNYNPQAVEEGDCSFDASEILQSNTWLMQSVTGDFAGTEINLLELEVLVPACTHDNLFLFHEDNSVTMDDNVDLCEDGEESVLDITGEWTVSGDVLTIENGADVYILTISELTSTSMSLLFDYYWADLDATIPAKIVLVAS